MTTLLFPRLSRELAGARLAQVRDRAPQDLSESVELLLPGHTFNPIGGRQLTTAELEGLREKAVDVARECGFPDERSVANRVRFDGRLGRLLHEEMSITPNQAADDELWSHLTLGPLLDLAAWRFPGMADERMLGNGVRSTFRRLWWRAEILGSLSWDEVTGLAEDETVQLMERPELTATPAVAQGLGHAFHRCVAANPGAKRMELMRDALKRAYRLTPFLRLEALTGSELATLLDDLFLESARQLSPDGAARPAQTDAPAQAETARRYRATQDGPQSGPVPPDGQARTEPDTSTSPPGVDKPTPEPRPAAQPAAQALIDARTNGTLESTPLASVSLLVARAIRTRAPVEDSELPDVVAEETGLEIKKKRRRMVTKFAWSGKGHKALTYDEDSGLWESGPKEPQLDDHFGQWSYADLVEHAQVLLVSDPDPFEQLLNAVVGDRRAPKVVASIVGMAVKEAKKAARPR